MFTGIIETLGQITAITQEQSNVHFTVRSSLASELKIDQSIAHNGVCLTVVAIDKQQQTHTVTAVHETLLKTNLNQLKEGDFLNLERCMRPDSRLDGHFVQGHVDQTAECVEVKESGGSWYFTFQYQTNEQVVLVDKGSICVDGTSLTVVKAANNCFSVAIIPYTYEHTIFKNYRVGSSVNLEFDIIGKYITKLFQQYKKQFV